jgi:outer membrane protein assembly factor BamB
MAADGILYVMTGFRGSALLAIRLGGTGDLSESDSILWKRSSDTPYVPSPLLYGNRLYFYKSNQSILTCLNAKDGAVLFGPQRLDGFENVYASLLGAADRVYLAGRNGTVIVIKNADTFEVLATNKMEDRFDASPVAVGNDLFLRGREYLYCIADQSSADASR